MGKTVLLKMAKAKKRFIQMKRKYGSKFLPDATRMGPIWARRKRFATELEGIFVDLQLRSGNHNAPDYCSLHSPTSKCDRHSTLGLVRKKEKMWKSMLHLVTNADSSIRAAVASLRFDIAQKEIMKGKLPSVEEIRKRLPVGRPRGVSDYTYYGKAYNSCEQTVVALMDKTHQNQRGYATGAGWQKNWQNWWKAEARDRKAGKFDSMFMKYYGISCGGAAKVTCTRHKAINLEVGKTAPWQTLAGKILTYPQDIKRQVCDDYWYKRRQTGKWGPYPKKACCAIKKCFRLKNIRCRNSYGITMQFHSSWKYGKLKKYGSDKRKIRANWCKMHNKKTTDRWFNGGKPFMPCEQLCCLIKHSGMAPPEPKRFVWHRRRRTPCPARRSSMSHLSWASRPNRRLGAAVEGCLLEPASPSRRPATAQAIPSRFWAKPSPRERVAVEVAWCLRLPSRFLHRTAQVTQRTLRPTNRWRFQQKLVEYAPKNPPCSRAAAATS